jgi:ATPase subunit of ABC transporter with duplicated ATPase domains
LVTAKGVNIQYGKNGDDVLAVSAPAAPLWASPIDCIIRSGDRIAIKGANGSGKTSFIKLLLGELVPSEGTVEKAALKYVYIDQDYSLIDATLTVYQQAQQFNSGALQEHEVKIRLHWFLFGKDAWDKPCHALSGGEKMRLILCCLTIGTQAPDIIVLDEPTNNLDIQNVEILTTAINGYEGTLLVVSHDEVFLSEIGIEHHIVL